MPRGSVALELDASADEAFDTIHDYGQRLAWDSMLSRAELVGGASSPGFGVRSLCVGTWSSGYLAIETEYVRFVRGQVAAVKLTNRPPFFDRFAASIRHEPLGPRRSRIVYTVAFRAKPQLLAFLLEPVILVALRFEIRARLKALARYLAAGRHR